MDVTQKTVTGKVRMKLYRGSIAAAGVSSPYSLYNTSIASFGTGELNDHADSKGFIRLYGLPILVRALGGWARSPASTAATKPSPTAWRAEGRACGGKRRARSGGGAARRHGCRRTA
ncbi:MAG: hypothetical protein A2001_10630 [Treponema sp. GWC1_61_84]|nr:MAG: hypothetical protein A2001_10630 [Treponema sp. GWC1_61_84]